MNFSYPFFIKFYYFYSAIAALKFKLSRKRSRTSLDTEANYDTNYDISIKEILDKIFTKRGYPYLKKSKYSFKETP
jgi:hypothetical protein